MRRRRARSAGRWSPRAAAPGPWPAGAGRRAPASRSRGRGPSTRRSSSPAPKMSRNSARRGDRVGVLAEAQVGLHLTRGTAGGGDQARRSARAAAHGRCAACRRTLHARRASPSGTGCACPAWSAASSVMWVNAPPPDTSSLPPLPHAPRRRSNREVFGRDVGLEPDDRLDPVLASGLVELVGAEEEPVVGDRDRRHLHVLDRGHEVGIRAAPSSIEYSECTCRWTNESLLQPSPPCVHPLHRAQSRAASYHARTN